MGRSEIRGHSVTIPVTRIACGYATTAAPPPFATGHLPPTPAVHPYSYNSVRYAEPFTPRTYARLRASHTPSAPTHRTTARYRCATTALLRSSVATAHGRRVRFSAYRRFATLCRCARRLVCMDAQTERRGSHALRRHVPTTVGYWVVYCLPRGSPHVTYAPS